MGTDIGDDNIVGGRGPGTEIGMFIFGKVGILCWGLGLRDRNWGC